MDEIQQIKTELENIKKRNLKVEIDKAWETSLMRKIIIIVLTYFTVVLFFYFANLPNPFVNSIVPAIGFILSSLSLPYFKKLWIKNKSI